MFKPINNEYTDKVLGAPKNWDSEKDGECIGLPVHCNGEVFFSWWKIDWKNRIKILFGKPVRLTIFSLVHPPVSLDTE